MLYRQIESNKRKTLGLMLLFCILVLIIGAAAGYLILEDYVAGLVLTAIILVFYVPITYFSASSQVLRMAGAKEIRKEDHPQLYNIVEELTLAARLPMPKIYIIDDPAPNAFAAGIKPEKAAVAYTTGLLEMMNREELEGVTAHELAHIRNYDIRLMTVCIALVGVISVLAQIGLRMMGAGRSGSRRSGGGRSGGGNGQLILFLVALVFIILAPLAANFVHLAVSRNREFLADATAVEITRNPVGLKNALLKIGGDYRDVRRADKTTASMYFASPFGSKRRKKERSSWFATHPPIAARVARLEQM